MFFGPSGLAIMTKDMPTWLYLAFLVPASMGQGFQFPGTFMAILAVSEQAEQAVVTSTLILWRSLGMVLGVAASSLVLQNALVGYLDTFVTGPDKEKVSCISFTFSHVTSLSPPFFFKKKKKACAICYLRGGC